LKPFHAARLVPGLSAFVLLLSSTAGQTVGGTWGLDRALEGTKAGDHFGTCVAGVGDLNGDGYADFAIGAPQADPGGRANAGRVGLYSGSDGSLIRAIDGTSGGDRLGSSVAGLGDIDGDGYDDLVIGAPEADPGGLSDAGSAVVISGATGALLYRFDGAASSDQFGNAVDCAGDVDGDGTPDLIVGAWWADPGGVSLAGSAFVYSGATGAQLHRFDGVQLGDTFAGAVAGVGDIDADGKDDVLIGAHNADPGGRLSAGSAFVYSGATGAELLRFDGPVADDWLGISVGAAGDVDLDGTPDLIIGSENASPGGNFKAGSAYVYSGATGLELYRFDGDRANALLGAAVDGAGDVDGDGTPDLIVGADGYKVLSMSDAGVARVYSGADGSLLHEAGGTAAGMQYGSSVAGGGDQDGDGLDEVMVGAARADPNSMNEAGIVEILGYFPGLFASADRIGAAAGGSVAYTIDFPDTEAGFSYALLASLAGTGPTSLGGIDVPLTSDFLLTRMSSGNAPAVFGNPYGVLNFAGDASPSLNLPPGFATAYVGQTVYLAAVSFQPPAAARLSSESVTLVIDP